MNTPHKHAEILHAIADGNAIESPSGDEFCGWLGDWQEVEA